MAPVLDRPFLDYLLQSLAQAGIKKVLFLTGYKAETISGRYGSRLANGMAVDYSVGTVDDQTGRRLLNAYAKLDERFLLLYGDNYWPIELGKMQRLFEEKKAGALTTVFTNKKGTAEYGWENNVEVGPDGFVRRYDKKRQANGLNGVDIGFFIVNRSLVDPSIQGNISFEETILARLAEERKLVGYLTDVQYYFITTLASLRGFEKTVKQKGFPAIEWEERS